MHHLMGKVVNFHKVNFSTRNLVFSIRMLCYPTEGQHSAWGEYSSCLNRMVCLDFKFLKYFNFLKDNLFVAVDYFLFMFLNVLSNQWQYLLLNGCQETARLFSTHHSILSTTGNTVISLDLNFFQFFIFQECAKRDSDVYIIYMCPVFL